MIYTEACISGFVTGRPRHGAPSPADAGLVCVGAPDDAGGGSAYLFHAQGGAQLEKLVATDGSSGDELGGSVAVAGGLVLVGAAGDDDLGSASGSAYTFAGGASVRTMSGCLANAGTLVHAGGLPLAGGSLTFVLASGQPGASTALLAVSAAPIPGWPACGLDLGSAGELLVDLSPASLLFLSAQPRAGSPVIQSVPVPALAGLQGLPVHAQGAFLAPTDPLEPMRLTGALELILGGYP